jgi:hypothetical protein
MSFACDTGLSTSRERSRSRSGSDLQRRAVDVRRDGYPAEAHQGGREVDETFLAPLRRAVHARARQDQDSLAVVHRGPGSPDPTQESIGVAAAPTSDDLEPR